VAQGVRLTTCSGAQKMPCVRTMASGSCGEEGVPGEGMNVGCAHITRVTHGERDVIAPVHANARPAAASSRWRPATDCGTGRACISDGLVYPLTDPTLVLMTDTVTLMVCLLRSVQRSRRQVASRVPSSDQW
jgi:hypothetical protein